MNPPEHKKEINLCIWWRKSGWMLTRLNNGKYELLQLSRPYWIHHTTFRAIDNDDARKQTNTIIAKAKTG